DSFFPAFLMQLAAQAPLLLAYLVGFTLALVFRSRYPGPALLTLIATIMLFVTSIAQSFLFLYITRAQVELGWDHLQIGWMFSLSAMVGCGVGAAAFGLLLAAVFRGRGRGARPVALPEPLPRAEPARGPADEQGITHRPGTP